MSQQDSEDLQAINVQQTKVAHVQKLIGEGMISDQLLQQEQCERTVLLDMMRREEAILRQKSRVQWLRSGDQNNAFFHRTVQTNNAKRTIRAIKNQQGLVLEKAEDMKNEAINFFQKLIGTADKEICSSSAELQTILKKTLIAPQQFSLQADVSPREIKQALSHSKITRRPAWMASQLISSRRHGT